MTSRFRPPPPLAFHLVYIYTSISRGLARHTIYAEYLIMPIVSPVTCTVAWTRASLPDIPRGLPRHSKREISPGFSARVQMAPTFTPPAASGSGDGREGRAPGGCWNSDGPWIKGTRRLWFRATGHLSKRGRIATREIRRAYIPLTPPRLVFVNHGSDEAPDRIRGQKWGVRPALVPDNAARILFSTRHPCSQ